MTGVSSFSAARGSTSFGDRSFFDERVTFSMVLGEAVALLEVVMAMPLWRRILS